MTKNFTYDEAKKASLEYFSGDAMAADVFVSKYALRNKENALLECIPSEMHMRLAKEFARIEAKYPNPMSLREIYGLLSNVDHLSFEKEYSEGDLILSSNGMGMVVAQGSPMSGIGNNHQYQSLSNCFVIHPPFDSYAGIMKTDQEQAQIMKRRGGVGFDISSIRPRGMTTSNAARTTDGIGVFMERFSNTCREVGQGGRRGALMLTIDIRHPEIETFINIKRDKKKVTGANVSIRFNDEFMTAVDKDEEFVLRWPVEASVAEAQITKPVRARDIWDQIIDAAWYSAEPGVLFWDRATKLTPSDIYKSFGFGSISTNPCIVGDTLIAVADGRNAVSIKKLAEEGRDVPVYSTNPSTGQVQIKWGRNPRLTKRNAEVWKLTLDDGSVLIATPDHKVMRRDLSYVELRNLKSGDSVYPFSSFNNNGYRQVCNVGAPMKGGTRRNRRQYRLIHEFFYGDVSSKTHAIHHLDFDSLNDNLKNLQVMTHEEHNELHAMNMRGEKNPYHKQSDDWKMRFAYHPGEQNGRYSGHTNEQLLQEGRKLFELNGRITSEMWAKHAKECGLPQFLSNEFRFGSWQNFANQVLNNHKVVSVEPAGTQDVYNITVDDNHNYHVITSHEDDRFVVSSGLCVKNCGEIILSPYDSCRLLVVNFSKFVRNPFKSDAYFDFEAFDVAAQKAQRLMDDLIDLEIEAVDRIIDKILSDPEPEDVKRTELDLWSKIRKAATEGRRTGLGPTALADALAMLNVRYGSEESIEWTEKLYKALELAAYRSTVKMAKERGAFPIFDAKLEKKHPFIEKILALDPQLKSDYEKYGRRNIALTTTAPVGSVSILTQTTSGIEPVFLTSYKRMRKINPGDDTAKVDMTDEMGDKWQEYTVYHPGVQRWMDATGETDIEKSPYWKATSADVDWTAGVKLQAAAQRWICHSISRTSNLPKNASHSLISDIYIEAWKSGCKGFTVYRDGSRTGVLLTGETATAWFEGIPTEELEKCLEVGRANIGKMPEKYINFLGEVEIELKKRSGEYDERPVKVLDVHAPKRRNQLECDIHRVNVKGESYTVLVGLLDNKPYEVFCGLSEQFELPKKIKSGLIIKNGKKDGVATYNLKIPMGDDFMLFKDIVNIFDNPTYGAFTRTISLALRHGVPIQFLVEQLRKDKHGDFTSFSNVIARVLSKNYIKDGTKVTEEKTCSSCNSAALVYQEGCVLCTNCGHSKCS